ncbi:phospholipase C [Teratosphaeria destructans]|uniref:Phospholipase C n=1 Tax=Teratosphaeria destructans TaxID=418781 RepID=A0A9W7SK73_9PEZI|nr:phospholipase C [Teratosphaeria destructans]
MAAGEMIIKHLYDALRNSGYCDSTLLIIEVEQHGGFAGHVDPPNRHTRASRRHDVLRQLRRTERNLPLHTAYFAELWGPEAFNYQVQ